MEMSAFGFELLETPSTPSTCSSAISDSDENQKILKTSAGISPNGFLKEINPELCVFTYRILRNEILREDDERTLRICEINGPIHWVELMIAIADLPQDSAPPKPEKLPSQIPEWTKCDVACWLERTGFEAYIYNFLGQAVDGDLLLQLTENELLEDLGMSSGLLRKRFLRELHKLKLSVDYSKIDVTNLEKRLEAVSPALTVYTYQMLSNGIDSKVLPSLTYEIMTKCGIVNPVHQLKLAKFYGIKEREAMKTPSIEDIVYISYRNSPGAELASLIKLYLEKYGYRVRMDIDNTEANDLEESLLRDVSSCKHLVLILTTNSLEPDQMPKELDFAFQFDKNIITVNHKDFEQTAEWQETLRTAFSVNWVHDYQEACIQKIINCFQEN
ncbi:hypothetical protein L3Y34_002275 [Caenorhabditis briggsae]|uniref:ADP-ribosyl cyclase/cyclic ADP-ribose hydrolase n=1 Tax=Caenorhabditis briggsae TaxID=6238 RepID=A0AAE9IRW1_CAEBR|nr:hypothetical protein L3Y34_002275 [Caenorhabditis briggsae]